MRGKQRAVKRRLRRHRVVCPRLIRVGLGRLEEPAKLLAQFEGVLVSVHRGGVLGGRANDVLLLADDRQRAVRVARPTTQSAIILAIRTSLVGSILMPGSRTSTVRLRPDSTCGDATPPPAHAS